MIGLTIHIVTATNDKYAKPLGVMVHSLLSNTRSAKDIHIHVIESDLSSKNKERLTRVVENAGASVTFQKIRRSLFKGLKTRPHLPQETYYRLAIPKLLEKDVAKVLYLDSDIVVKTDITRLYNMRLGKYYLAAVRRPAIPPHIYKRLGIPRKMGYFNAGVLLINLNKWRRYNVAERVLKFGKRKYLIKFPSQDPLNAVLRGKWKKLSRKWNYTSTYAKKNARVRPYIIHFSGPDKKPWDKHNRHPFRKQYYKYKRTLKWHD